MAQLQRSGGTASPDGGWLVTPLTGSDGDNYGFIQVTDRLEGDFTEQDETNLVRLATLTSTALDALAQLHLPDYRDKLARNEAQQKATRL